jgi:hypothetical protein
MKNNSQAFANQLVVCLLVAIGFVGSVGLSMVWMRHQNSSLAKSNSDLAARIAAVDRRTDELAAVIQSEQRPDLLRALNVRMNLALLPMNEVPVVHVRENVAERMAERANRGLLPDAAAPARVKFALR